MLNAKWKPVFCLHAFPSDLKHLRGLFIYVFVCFIDLLPLSHLASVVHCVVSCHTICAAYLFVALSSALIFLTCVLSRSVCLCVFVNVRFLPPAGPLVQPGQEEREENLVRPATDSVAAQSIIQSPLSFRSIRFFPPLNEPMKTL